MQSLKLRREKLNAKEHDLRESLANFEKYINVREKKQPFSSRSTFDNGNFQILGTRFETNASVETSSR